MTYLGFHLLFTVPPIVFLSGLLAVRHPTALRAMSGKIALIAVIAVIYTTPWDNYLVFKGVWTYGYDRVIGTIGYVPLEEYGFFVLQTTLTGLLLTWWIEVRPRQRKLGMSAAAKYAGSGLLLFAAATGILAFFQESTLYLGLIICWAFPVLLLQWVLGWKVLQQTSPVWLPVVAVATLYLAAADAIAIASGTWAISDRFTTGLSVFSLPVEEGLFFLVTNLLVAWGLLLFRAYALSRARPRP